jgi:hypothetical protein
VPRQEAHLKREERKEIRPTIYLHGAGQTLHRLCQTRHALNADGVQRERERAYIGNTCVRPCVMYEINRPTASGPIVGLFMCMSALELRMFVTGKGLYTPDIGPLAVGLFICMIQKGLQAFFRYKPAPLPLYARARDFGMKKQERERAYLG